MRLNRPLAAAGLGLAVTLLPPMLASGASAQTPAAASPVVPKGLPMWVIKDADSLIYVTGTIHLLPDGAEWLSPRLEGALAEAKEVWFEIAEVGAPEGMTRKIQPLIEELAALDGPPLSEELSEEEYERLIAALKDADVAPEAIAKIDHLAPWYAGYLLSRTPFTSGNYESANGIDNALARIAFAQGDVIKGLETVEDQLGPAGELTYDEQIEYLRDELSTNKEMREAQQRVGDLAFGSWMRGEIHMVEALVGLMNFGASATGSSTDALLKDRNEKWAGQVEEMLEGAGVTFIAVGAAHLVGPDSLQQRLKLRGITAERY